MRDQKKKRVRQAHSSNRRSAHSAKEHLDFVSIVDRYKDAVVNIEVTQAVNQNARPLPFPFNLPMFNTPGMQPKAMNIGTGFIFDKRGYILTNEHVIHGSSQVNVKLFGKGKTIPAKVVGTHYQHDLAVLKVNLPHEVPVLRLGESSDVKVGEWVIAIGKPMVQFSHHQGDEIMSAEWSEAMPGVRLREATLTFGADKRYATFDRTGRLLFLTEPGRAIRRGLDHRMVESLERPYGRSYRDLAEVEKRELVEFVRAAVNRYLSSRKVAGEERERLLRVLAWTPEELAKDEANFRQVYLPISILPPDQYRTLVVQATEGCSYNRCLFCDFYRDRPFHIKSDAELAKHATDLAAFFGERLIDRSGVFLGDGNALVIPTRRLLEMIEYLRQALPPTLLADGIATFMDTFSLERKSVKELRSLRDAGMRTVYVGFETGADDLRRFLLKQGTAEEAVAAMVALKRAGYQLAVILLVGAGGKRFAERHVKDTLAALSRLPLERGDLVYLSPFVEPEDTGYQEAISSSGIEALSAEALRAQYEWLRQALAAMHPGIRVTLYAISQHLY